MSVRRRAVFVLALVVFTITPATAFAGGTGKGHGDPSAHRSLRQAVTDQNFYFVMADRFANGDTSNDNGGLPPGKGAGQSGFDPTGKGWYHGGDLKGLTREDRLHQGARDDRDLADAELQEQGRPAAGQLGRLPRLLDHRLHADRPAPGHQRRTCARSSTPRTRAGSRSTSTSSPTTRPTSSSTTEADQRKPYTSKDRLAVPHGVGHAVRRPRLRRREPRLPGALADRPAVVRRRPGPLGSFPYHPCVPDAERNVKVPAWLNDVSLYHNRGDTTFIGENSALRRLLRARRPVHGEPAVVNGMIDIYKGWIRDFRIDGFRMDTMKHVNDEFWQKFSPAIVDYAKSQGIDDFYMFGEVAEDFSQPFLSHFTTHDDVQGVLDFPFQMSAVDFAGHSKPTADLKTFFENDDWYTDGDSNVYNLPTFLGNHDRGRIGMFLRNANPGASGGRAAGARRARARADVLLARQPRRLLRRRAGLHGRGRRPGRAPGHVPVAEPAVQQPRRPDRRRRRRGQERQHRLGRDADGRQLRPRATCSTASSPAWPPSPSATRRCATAPSSTGTRRRARAIYAFSRIDRSRKHEYVVALNNSEQPASASVPTFVPDSKWEKVWGSGDQRLRSGADKRARRRRSPRCRRSCTAPRSTSRAAARRRAVSVA